MPQFDGLQNTVEALNKIAGIHARLILSPRMRPRVEIEPEREGSSISLDMPVASLIAGLLEDKQLGYLQVRLGDPQGRRKSIGAEAVKTLGDAIRGNSTAIEINLCSMNDLLTMQLQAELLDAARQSNNPNLDSFRPCEGHFGKRNVEDAAELMNQIATRPQEPIDCAQVRARIPLIETLARCRWMRDPVTLKQFVSNLNHCLAGQEASPDEPVLNPSFSELGKGVAPKPIVKRLLNDWETPRARVAGARTIRTAQVPELSITELVKNDSRVARL